MKLKTVEVSGKTYAEIVDGKPVYVHDDGKEVPFDAPTTVSTISRLNGEAKGHRERAEAAEGRLKAFDGLDAAAAKDALSKIANIDAKKLIDAGEVEKVKAEVSKVYETKLADAEKRSKTLEERLNSEIIGGSFARSKFISEKIAVPTDMIQATFGARFTLDENGKLIAKDATGSQIYSRINPGSPADFEEALEVLVSAYPHKDHILKGTGNSGTGATGGSRGGTGGAKTLTRAQFEAIPPAERAAKITDGFQIVD